MFEFPVTRFSMPLCGLVCSALVGCASQPTQIDRQFGVASKDAFSRQQIIPDAALSTPVLRTSDGSAMKSAIDRYHKSFEILPVPVNIFNIGVGTPMVASPQR